MNSGVLCIQDTIGLQKGIQLRSDATFRVLAGSFVSMFVIIRYCQSAHVGRCKGAWNDASYTQDHPCQEALLDLIYVDLGEPTFQCGWPSGFTRAGEAS